MIVPNRLFVDLGRPLRVAELGVVLRSSARRSSCLRSAARRCWSCSCRRSPRASGSLSGFVNRPAPKNQSLSCRIGPPSVASYTGVILSTV